ncbi:MAG: AmmeMemoRadiSam system radical SAM enzyme [Candidatus Aureabacteria bacterium]|nr:AmmeMemoRadiSam system radical SAM enzyme [Candidatus Auribacterota bacterium]
MKKNIFYFLLISFLFFSDTTSVYAEKEAMFYKNINGKTIRCDLCPHKCILDKGETGFCKVRLNRDGKLYSLVFGKPCTVNIGPIEKAPFYHFLPGSKRLCVATAGCNMRCSFCQNWQISQNGPEDIRSFSLTPEELVQKAAQLEIPTICYTYSEPIVFYEYMYESSILAKNSGIRTTMVSNGFINSLPMKKLIPYLDAVKIDLKAFSTKFYEDICDAKLEEVKNTLKLLKENKKHFEIVVLIIPTLNDSDPELNSMCKWISVNLGNDIPIHFSRFVPSYKLTSLPMTPVKTLERAHKIAKKNHLKYVYIGNVPGHIYNSTYCPSCGKILVKRMQYEVTKLNISKGKCKFCGLSIPGVWE